MSPITLIVMYLGIGTALAWLRWREGARFADIPWGLLVWPLDWVIQFLAVLHENSLVGRADPR